MVDSLVPVAVACPCPGTPHSDGDTVFLGPKLSFRAGVMADSKIADIVNGSGNVDEVKAVLLETYILDGVKAWTFVDAEGTDIEVTPATIQAWLLSDYSIGVLVSEQADKLYSEAVSDPLARRSFPSLQTGPTNGSTSRKSGSSAKRRKPSKPSSTTTSPTVGT
jgi:hypothetical protein